MKFSPGKVPTFGDFSQDISRCKVRQDFSRFRFKIIKQVGEFQKNSKKNMKYWHQGRGKKTLLVCIAYQWVFAQHGWDPRHLLTTGIHRFWGSVNAGDTRWTKRPPHPIRQTLVIAPNDPTRACTQDILYFRLLAQG